MQRHLTHRLAQIFLRPLQQPQGAQAPQPATIEVTITVYAAAAGEYGTIKIRERLVSATCSIVRKPSPLQATGRRDRTHVAIRASHVRVVLKQSS
jgi:hypothetical protein